MAWCCPPIRTLSVADIAAGEQTGGKGAKRKGYQSGKLRAGKRANRCNGLDRVEGGNTREVIEGTGE